MAYLDSLQIFHGEANPARARFYARLARSAEHRGWRLAGRISGPHNALASTLPAGVPLRDLGPGPTLLAEAVLPDPCFWSPDSPALYEAEVALIDERGKERETIAQQLGIRSFGARGGSLYLEGKRFVVRAVDRTFASAASAAAWREAWCSPFAVSPDEAFLAECSRLGVLTISRIAGTRSEVEAELCRLSRWAAVAMAMIDCPDPLDESIAAAAPNLLLGWRMGSTDASLPPWASVVFADASEPSEFVRGVAQFSLPLVAMRNLEGSATLADARSACDVLQKDLAPHGDFAGYVVY